jgi:hypothetical protein
LGDNTAMRSVNKLSAIILCLGAALFAARPAAAQKSQAASRVVEAVDETRTVRTPGNVHPFARAEFDRGAVAASQPMTRMLLLLQRSPEQETALQQLMDAQQTKGSANFHAWMTPEQFGAQFGPSDADVQAVTDWLTRQGFQIAKVSAGRTTIEFSGTVAQVRSAFQTEIHKFAVSGHDYFANTSDPTVPSALAPVVRGVVALHNFPKQSHLHRVGNFQRNLATGQVKSLFTYVDLNGTFYGVGPADFAKIYNIPAGADGSGQSIAIVGQSNINIQDVRDFRTIFGLPANDPQIILNGPDPGLLGPTSTGDEGESDLDVEWAGAVAPKATIKFVTSQSTQSNPAQVSSGIDLSALYIIDNNVAPVMSESYGACESNLGTLGNAFYNALWQQAAAQGITVAISSGDNGSAGCDPTSSSPNAAVNGIAVSGLASTPYNVAVGGTDFDQFGSESTYWNAATANVPGSQLSVKGYIPEVPWNDSLCAANYPAACSSVDANGGDVTAGSGGPSAVYAKPTWQTSLVPSGTFRHIPDVSFFASNGFNNSFYIICESDTNPSNAPCDLSTSPTSGTHNFSGVGGTSGSTPAFAAVMALVNQYQLAHGGVGRQGNANYVLYALAAKDTNYTTGKCNSSLGSTPAASCVFYDTTKGNNSVACVASSTNCKVVGGAPFGIVADASGNPAFTAVAGYDQATGLGTINVTNLLAAWSSSGVSFRATTTTLKLNGATTAINVAHDTSVAVSIQVQPTAGAGTPSGIVTLRDPSGVVLDTFTLSNGSFSGHTSLLLGGSYGVTAHYGGDGTFGAGDSTPAIPVTIAKENSKTTISYVGFSSTGVPSTPTTTPSPIVYGSPYILRIDVTGANGTQCATSSTTYTVPCPTGKITLTDGGVALNDFPNTNGTPNPTNSAVLNNQGFAEDQPVQLSGGTHSIAASYVGDPSYQPSTSNTLSITVTPTPTQVSLSSDLPSVTVNQPVTLTAQVLTQSNSQVGTTGTVTFLNGGVAIGSPAAVTAIASTQTTPAGGIATLTTTFSTSGNKSITAHYNGDSNYAASTLDGSITLAVTGSGSGTVTLSATSAAVTAGGSAPSTITVTPINGFTGAAIVTCTSNALPAGVSCSPSPLNVTITGAAAVTGTMNVSVLAPSSSLSAQNLATNAIEFAATKDQEKGLRVTMAFAGGGGIAFLFLFGISGRKRVRSAFLGLIFCSVLLVWGCGGGSSGGGGGGGGSIPTTTAMTVNSTKLPFATGTLNINILVSSASSTPSGSVQFYDGGTLFGPPINLTNGAISLTLTQANATIPVVGTHALSAHYLGDTTHIASASGSLNITITGTTTVPLTANPASTANVSIPLTIN